MSTNITLNPRGLFTNYNTLSQVDPGSLLRANNVLIDEKGIVRSRRGIKYYSDSFGTSPAFAERARQLLEYKGRIIRHVGNKLAFDNGSGVFTDFSGVYSDAVVDARIKGIEYKGNFYFTSNDGVKKISAKTVNDINANSIMNTGAPISEGLKTSLLADANGFIAADQYTSYVVTWGYNDQNNLLIEGVPSTSVEAINNTEYGNFSVNCKIYIPDEVTTNYFFRLYRSETRATTEALSTEYRLVFQGNPTLSEISNGYLNYTDGLSEDFRNAGVALYTNPYSGEGATQINYAPPVATDIALYQNHIFYANTRLKHSKIITLQSIDNFVSGFTNFIVTDGTFGRTYTFRGNAEVSTVTCQPFSFLTDGDYFLLNSARNEKRYFVYFQKTPTTTIPSHLDTLGRIAVACDIQGLTSSADVATKLASTLEDLNDFTTLVTGNIVSITNTENGEADAVADSIYQPTNLVFATFFQGDGEDFSTNHVLLQSTALNTKLEALDTTARSLVDCINNDPLSFVTALYVGNGQIFLTAKTFDDIIFYTTTTQLSVVASWFPNLSSNTNGSDASKNVNGLYFSKQDQPESVPLVQSLLIGSSDEPILRIVPLRESMFIFKTDGLYRLSGYDKNSFSVTLFDSTAILKASDSTAVLRNQIYYFGTQGVSRVSEGGEEKLSDPIDNKLIPFITTCPQLANLTFAVSYETDESYLLWTALAKNNTVAQVCYRYNLHTDSWVEWKIAKTCAVLNTNEDKLYFGSGDAATLEVERKDFERFDYADREIEITLPALSSFNNIVKPSGASQIEAGDVLYQVQGITVSQLNQVLTMLSIDPEMNDQTYLTFKASAGDSIQIKIGSLVNYLNTVDTTGFTDTHGNTSYVFTGSTNIITTQTEWFKIIDRLNQSTAFFRSNYPKYNKLTPIEASVVKRDISNNDIYLDIEYPFLEGSMILFKAIQTEIEFVPQTGGDSSNLKQFTSCQIIFQNRSISNAQIGFNSDLSTDFEYVSFALSSAGTWGNFEWGNGAVWGGEGDQAPLRTYVPSRKQRCRFIGLRFKHIGALENFSLYGLALSYTDTSDRAYR